MTWYRFHYRRPQYLWGSSGSARKEISIKPFACALPLDRRRAREEGRPTVMTEKRPLVLAWAHKSVSHLSFSNPFQYPLSEHYPRRFNPVVCQKGDRGRNEKGDQHTQKQA
ncbi:MAG: hypothetical protein PHW87_02315 [Methanothrix sp.]|nr:hypothetical protein [Methanothrix sp.]